MAIWKLTDTQLPAPSTPFPKKKVFGDGGGLCLVCIGGSKTWQLRYQIANGPTRTMGLGPYPVVSLAAAREAARVERAKFKVPGERVDPIDARKAARTAAAVEAARSITFEEACEKYLAAHGRKWADPRGVSDWRSVMKAWVYPIIGATPIADVDRMAVLRVLKQTVEGKPFRDARPKVFQRVAVRIRDVIAWAVVETYRPAGVNPADGHDLKLAFPRVKKDAEVEHRKSLPVEQCPELWRTLNANIETPRVKPLMFAMLTGARIGEVMKATWNEIDLAGACWTVPAAHQKKGRRVRRPLSKAAVALLEGMASNREPGAPVFPQSNGKPYALTVGTNDVMKAFAPGYDQHGLRSSLKVWALKGGAPLHMAEWMLDHIVENPTGRSYGSDYDAFEERAVWFEGWAKYLQG